MCGGVLDAFLQEDRRTVSPHTRMILRELCH
jgi:hypothetical protein